MADSDREGEALRLVKRGWGELQVQRPLAAWACWQQALRVRPDDLAASQALELLEQADELPLAARETYRLRSPEGEESRGLWNERMTGADLSQLDAATEAFADLFDADPTDSSARYNQALGLAWQGRNAEAIRALDDVVHLQSRSDLEAAEQAWTLAEVLRQGAGAEALADDVNEGLTISWDEADGEPTNLAGPGLIREAASPVEPAEGVSPEHAVRVFEWLDRPMPSAQKGEGLSVLDVPRVFATMILAGGRLRLFAPRRGAGEAMEEALGAARIDLKGRAIEPETTALTLRLLDADALSFRLPKGLEAETRSRLSRESIEHYYEHIWPKTYRAGLAVEREEADPDEPPVAARVMEASRRVLEGDAVARAKLSAVVRLRQQLGQRPRVAVLYGGYPFDRLRRRLGLEPIHQDASSEEDVSAMSAGELNEIDPAALDESVLIDAFRSAVGLGARDPASRFLGAILERSVEGLRREEDVTPFLAKAVDPESGNLERALERLETLGDRPLWILWKARLLARAGRFQAATEAYRDYLNQNPDDAEAAIEAAGAVETGDPRAARDLAEEALERGRRAGDAVSVWNAERFLDGFDSDGGDR